MTQKTADIERIVRDVLADLGLATAVCERTSESTAEKTEPAPVVTSEPLPPPRPAGDVVIADRVVTLAGIGERLASARRLVVPPRAVVTPAVRDELRRRNVTLVVEENSPTNTSTGRKVAMTVLGSKIDSKPVVDELARQGLVVDVQRVDCLVRATDDMARQLRNTGTTGIVLSNYGAIAMCLANRHQGVRAVLASDESRTATDAVSVGANLLVAEPRRLAPEMLVKLVSAFCQQGPGECPKELLDRLS